MVDKKKEVEQKIDEKAEKEKEELKVRPGLAMDLSV